tara:strand:- start:1252 stop:2256 length:1005 start_codon:yes stop_codon:yes gene_type:complete
MIIRAQIRRARDSILRDEARLHAGGAPSHSRLLARRRAFNTILALHGGAKRDREDEKTQEEVDAKKIKVYGDANRCAICYEPPKDPVLTNCGHTFCDACLQTWKDMHKDDPTCPVCRAKLPANAGDEFIQAAKDGNHAMIRIKLVSIGTDVAKAALYVAAAGGHATVVEMLLAHRVEPDNYFKYPGKNPWHGRIRWYESETPMLAAARNGHAAVVALLLSQGVDVDKEELVFGDTPCYAAAANGHTDVVRMLLASGADPDKERTEEGATPCFIAAENGHADVIQLLLDFGANPNKTDHYGGTPCRTAAEEGHAAVVALLQCDDTGLANVNEPSV